MINKKITLCADDYGQNIAVSRGILELVQRGIISAVSCLVNREDFNFYAERIKPFLPKIDIGLHFNLTDNYKLILLLVKSKLHLLKRVEMEVEFNQQLNRFIQIMGREPDFIDGHQHVHQLPVICDAIFNVCNKRLGGKIPYIRYVNYEKFSRLPAARLKSLAIKLITDLRFKSKLKNLKIPYNRSFSGIYDFKNSYKYNKIFPQFLSVIQNNGIIMCHAGMLSNDPEDFIAKNRYDEWQYFTSEQFLIDCKNAGIVIGKFSR